MSPALARRSSRHARWELAAQEQPFFPALDIPGLVLWLDAGRGVSNLGAAGFTWADQATQGAQANNGTQATTSKQPSQTTSPAGTTAFHFDNTDDNIVVGAGSDLDVSAAAYLAVWYQSLGNGSGARQELFFHIPTGTGTGKHTIRLGQNRDTVAYLIGTGTSTTSTGVFNTVADTAWHFVETAFDGSLTGDTNRRKMWWDGVQQTVTGSGDPVPATLQAGTDGCFVGSTNTNSLPLNGNIAHVYLANKIPPTYLREKLRRFEAPIAL